VASEDAFETSIRTTARAWRQGELGRREAVELMARAIELHMNQLALSAPTNGEPGAVVHIHQPREPLDEEGQAFEQLYDEARAFWASGRGRRRLGK
jgi:hypothetical protein